MSVRRAEKPGPAYIDPPETLIKSNVRRWADDDDPVRARVCRECMGETSGPMTPGKVKVNRINVRMGKIERGGRTEVNCQNSQQV